MRVGKGGGSDGVDIPTCESVECVSKCFPRETGGIEVGESEGVRREGGVDVSEALRKVL